MERHTASVNFGSFLGAGGVRQYAKNMAAGRADAGGAGHDAHGR